MFSFVVVVVEFVFVFVASKLKKCDYLKTSSLVVQIRLYLSKCACKTGAKCPQSLSLSQATADVKQDVHTDGRTRRQKHARAKVREAKTRS